MLVSARVLVPQLLLSCTVPKFVYGLQKGKDCVGLALVSGALLL